MKQTEQKRTRGAVLPNSGKTRVTMYLDDDVISYFRDQASLQGRGYQTVINAQLRRSMNHESNQQLPGELERLAQDLRRAVEEASQASLAMRVATHHFETSMGSDKRKARITHVTLEEKPKRSAQKHVTEK